MSRTLCQRALESPMFPLHKRQPLGLTRSSSRFSLNPLPLPVRVFPTVGDGSKKIKGCYDSIHVFEVQETSRGSNATYKLTSTVMLWLEVSNYEQRQM